MGKRKGNCGSKCGSGSGFKHTRWGTPAQRKRHMKSSPRYYGRRDHHRRDFDPYYYPLDFDTVPFYDYSMIGGPGLGAPAFPSSYYDVNIPPPTTAFVPPNQELVENTVIAPRITEEEDDSSSLLMIAIVLFAVLIFLHLYK